MKNVTLQSLLFSKIPCTFLAFPPRRNIISRALPERPNTLPSSHYVLILGRFKIHVMIQTFEKKRNLSGLTDKRLFLACTCSDTTVHPSHILAAIVTDISEILDIFLSLSAHLVFVQKFC